MDGKLLCGGSTKCFWSTCTTHYGGAEQREAQGKLELHVSSRRPVEMAGVTPSGPDAPSRLIFFSFSLKFFGAEQLVRNLRGGLTQGDIGR